MDLFQPDVAMRWAQPEESRGIVPSPVRVRAPSVGAPVRHGASHCRADTDAWRPEAVARVPLRAELILHFPLSHGEQLLEDARPLVAQPRMLKLIRHPGAAPAQHARCGLRVLALDINIIIRHERSASGLPRAQLRRPIQLRPVRLAGKQLRRRLERAQPGVVLPHPGIDHLSGQENRRVALGQPSAVVPGGTQRRLYALGGPAAGRARPIAVDGLVQQPVDWVGLEGGLSVFDSDQEELGQRIVRGPRGSGELEKVVESLQPGLRAEQKAQL
mmetsp:Transcript_11046/g.36672  ORF Transcript_11046/g.36672 Transcript_11046/m.36672 type:complete len:273 (+) Transcript_11046:147-965(+)